MFLGIPCPELVPGPTTVRTNISPSSDRLRKICPYELSSGLLCSVAARGLEAARVETGPPKAGKLDPRRESARLRLFGPETGVQRISVRVLDMRLNLEISGLVSIFTKYCILVYIYALVPVSYVSSARYSR